MYIVSNAHFYILICASTFKTDIYMVDAIQVMYRREEVLPAALQQEVSMIVHMNIMRNSETRE